MKNEKITPYGFDLTCSYAPPKKPDIATITAGIGINLSEPIKVSVDYDWIIEQLDKKLGNCPEDVKKALLEIEQKTVEDLKRMPDI